MRFSPRQVARIGHAALTRAVPVYAHWGVTHRCPLRCRMCGIWRYGDRAEELTLPQVEVMADRMARIGVAHLTLGGGEPFVREDLPEIVRAFSRRGIAVRVLTNGVHTDPDALARVVEAGGVHFSVSLDSLHPARYDEVCGEPEAWTRGVRTMTRIAALTLPRGGMPLLNCVVSAMNLDELPDIVRFAGALGFRASLLPVELLDEPTVRGAPWETRFIRHCPDLAIRPEDAAGVADRIRAAYERILAMKAEGAPILNTSPYLRASRDYLLTGRFPARRCDAGRLYFSVAPNGQYTVCHAGQQHHRSFLDDGFEEYWFSDEHERRRREEVDACGGCMRACWIDTSFIFGTAEGFFETARDALLARPTRRPLSYEEALGWARWEP